MNVKTIVKDFDANAMKVPKGLVGTGDEIQVKPGEVKGYCLVQTIGKSSQVKISRATRFV